jgi:hypothetical protein
MLATMLESMDRTVALESIYAFEHLKRGLKEYLKDFAKEGRVVQSQDILGFFEVEHQNFNDLGTERKEKSQT